MNDYQDTRAEGEPQEISWGNYEEIGQELREQRLKLGLKPADVASQLRLPGMVINDLESGRVAGLSALYRRGYIRNYARFLGLDEADMLARLDQEPPPELHQVLPISRPRWQVERYLKFITYAIVTIAIVPPIMIGAARMLDRDVGPEVNPVQLSISDVAERSQAELPAKSRPGGDTVTRHISAAALPLPARATAESDVAVDERPRPELQPEPAAITSRLSLRLEADSWVEIHDSASQRLEYDLLRAGQERVYEGMAPFNLLLGSARAVRLSLDGQEIHWEGQDRGDVSQILVTADGQIQPGRP